MHLHLCTILTLHEPRGRPHEQVSKIFILSHLVHPGLKKGALGLEKGALGLENCALGLKKSAPGWQGVKGLTWLAINSG